MAPEDSSPDEGRNNHSVVTVPSDNETGARPIDVLMGERYVIPPLYDDP